MKPAITGDQPNQHSEDHALHHASHQIADEEGLDSLLQVITAPEPQQRRPHPVATENARQIGEHGQARHRTQERQDTWEQEKTARVQGHGPHGINFFCHNHGAQLGGDGRAAAAGHDDGGNQRRHFPSHRYADQVGDINRGAKLTQLTGAIERQDGTDEEGEERDDWHSLYADLHDLFKRAVPFDPLAAPGGNSEPVGDLPNHLQEPATCSSQLQGLANGDPKAILTRLQTNATTALKG